MKTSLMLANNHALLIATATFIPKITNDLFCSQSAHFMGCLGMRSAEKLFQSSALFLILGKHIRILASQRGSAWAAGFFVAFFSIRLASTAFPGRARYRCSRTTQ
jgi:hypothetical protein